MSAKAKTRPRSIKPKSAALPCKSPPEVYALRAWSVKKFGDNWYVSPTACLDNRPEWSKPYPSLHLATTAIARKLAEEVLTRQKRRAERYGSTQ